MGAYGNLTKEQQREVDSIFNDEEFLACMERGLSNDGEPADQNLASARVDEAIVAFSANPPEFRAMLHKRKDSSTAGATHPERRADLC